MNIHGFFHSDQEMAAMIENVDKNRNGTIDFEEFLEMMVNINESLADHDSVVAKAFQVFDMVRCGCVECRAVTSYLTWSEWRRTDHSRGDQGDNEAAW